MKVALLTRFFSRANGGLGEYSLHILNGLLDRGIEVDPIATTRRSRLGYLYYSMYEIRSRVPKDVDIYHACTPAESFYIPNDKSVVTIHDMVPWLHSEILDWHNMGITEKAISKVRGLWSKFGHTKAAHIKRIICNSNATMNEFWDTFSGEGIGMTEPRVIRMGINPSLEPKDVGKCDHYTIGTLTHLQSRKRIDLLIKAFECVEDNNARLKIAGQGEQLSKLKRLALDDNRIEFLGFIPEEEKVDFYNSLDVFVLPSLHEGYGIPFIESMACRIPVITLADAYIPEEIRIRSHSVTKEELGQTLRNRDYRCHLYENKRFADLHSWDNCVDETIDVYEEIMNGR